MAVEVAEAFNAAVAAARSLNAFTVETPEDALAAAEAADKARARAKLRALAGIPLGIKDLFATRACETTAGSRILAGFKPPYECTVTANLRNAGRGDARQAQHGRVRDGLVERDERFRAGHLPGGARAAMSPLAPGGSSGGSVRGGRGRIAPGATGTDTGGSIRQPAAFTGICGIKPTYGRCSRWGVVAFASSLDQAGPMARDVRDCAILLEAMAGFDPRDATSLDLPVPQWEAGSIERSQGQTRRNSQGISHRWCACARSMRSGTQGIEWLKDAGAEPVEVTLPHTKYALPAYYIIAPAEASSNLARYDGVRYGLRDLPTGPVLTDMYAATRAAGFGAEVKRRIMIGTYVLSAGFYDAYFNQAQKVRALIARDFAQALEQCDLLLTPTAPSAAFGLGEKSPIRSPCI